MKKLIAVTLTACLVGCGYFVDKKELADWVRSDLSVKPIFGDFDIADVGLTRESANVFVGWVEFRFEGEEARAPLRVTLDRDSRVYSVEPPSALVLARQHARFALDFSDHLVRIFQREEDASGHLGPGIALRRPEIYQCVKKASVEAQLDSGVQTQLLNDIRGLGPARSASASDFGSRFQRCGEQLKNAGGDNEQPWSAKADNSSGSDESPPARTDTESAIDRLEKDIKARWNMPTGGGWFYCRVRVAVRGDGTAGAVRFDQPCGSSALHDSLVATIRSAGVLGVPDNIDVVPLSFSGEAPAESASVTPDISQDQAIEAYGQNQGLDTSTLDRAAREWVRLSRANMTDAEKEKTAFISEASKRRFGVSLEDILHHCARNGFQKVRATLPELNRLFGVLRGNESDRPPPPWFVAFGSFYESCTKEPWNYNVPGTAEMRQEALNR